MWSKNVSMNGSLVHVVAQYSFEMSSLASLINRKWVIHFVRENDEFVRRRKSVVFLLAYNSYYFYGTSHRRVLKLFDWSL
jgi:hypothetical protein